MSRLPTRVRPLIVPSLTVSLLAPVLLASFDAGAEEPRPATWDMSESELQAIGLGQDRGDPIPVPADAPRLNADRDPSLAKQGRIFVNFDGAQLSSGYDDSRNNMTQIGQLAGNFAPYGDGTKREAVMQAVRTDWAAYDVVITDVRPASGDYTMNMTGPSNPFGGGVLGIAPLDCYDSQTHNNITYAFHSVNDQFSAAVTATTIAQEVAHSYGLEHVDEPGDIMNPYNAGGDASFIDACIQIVSNQGIACGQQHADHCGTSNAQNAHQELLDLFGTAVPDTAAPTVSIVYPEDGDVFEPGADFEIEVEAMDDNAMDELDLLNNGNPMGSDASEPYGWGVTDIPEGEYEFQVIARDAAGNEAMSNIVTIVVGEAPSTTDGGTNSGTDGSDGGSDTDASGDTDGGGMPMGTATDTSAVPFGEDEAETGCGCRTQPVTGPGFMLGLLGLLGLRRRRGRS